MSRPLGVLLAGFAGEGEQNHQGAMYAPAFAAHPGFRVAAVTDAPGTAAPAQARAREAAERHAVAYIADLDTAMARDDIDVVSMCVPFDARVAAITAALEHGRNVLVDKPLAGSAAECRTIARVAVRTGRVCMPAHHHRSHPSVQSARSAVAAGRIGLPWNVQADFLVSGGPAFPLGELINFGPYPIDVVRALTGLEITDVYAATGPADDVLVLCLRHEHGMTSTITVGRVAGGSGVLQRYRISGSHGVLVVDTEKPSLTVRTGTGDRRSWVGADTVTRMLDELHAAVSGDRPGEPGPADAVAAMTVIEAVRASADGGRSVPVGPGDRMEATT